MDVRVSRWGRAGVVRGLLPLLAPAGDKPLHYIVGNFREILKGTRTVVA